MVLVCEGPEDIVSLLLSGNRVSDEGGERLVDGLHHNLVILVDGMVHAVPALGHGAEEDDCHSEVLGNREMTGVRISECLEVEEVGHLLGVEGEGINHLPEFFG